MTGRDLILIVVLRRMRGSRVDGDNGVSDAALTGRELEIVEMIALGLIGPEIATELHVSHPTVRAHVRNAMNKLGTRSRAHLVAKALGDGVVPTPRMG